MFLFYICSSKETATHHRNTHATLSAGQMVWLGPNVKCFLSCANQVYYWLLHERAIEAPRLEETTVFAVYVTVWRAGRNLKVPPALIKITMSARTLVMMIMQLIREIVSNEPFFWGAINRFHYVGRGIFNLQVKQNPWSFAIRNLLFN